MKLIFPPAFKMNKEVLYPDIDYCFSIYGAICEVGTLKDLEECPYSSIISDLWVHAYNNLHKPSHIFSSKDTKFQVKIQKNG